jgi:hypothetical protein
MRKATCVFSAEPELVEHAAGNPPVAVRTERPLKVPGSPGLGVEVLMAGLYA